MTTTTLRHYHVASVYRTPKSESQIQIPHQRPIMPRSEIQHVARIWFNKRKLRQHTRQIMDFMSLPSHVTLKYKLR